MAGKFLTTMVRGVKNIGFGCKKHSPEIFITLGVIGAVGAGVMACFATTKIGEVIDKKNADLEAIEKGKNDGEVIDREGDLVEYTAEDAAKDTRIVYAKTAWEMCKLYAPAVGVAIVSFTCIITSHRILHRRNLALGAAYAAVDRSFRDYRRRTIERFGDEVDKELRYDIKPVPVEETIVDEKGKEKKVKKTANVIDPKNLNSEYVFLFDKTTSPDAQDNPDYNEMFVTGVERYARHKLIADGRLFMNDVLKELGIQPTKAGQIVGWVYDKNNDDIDNYVDFGMRKVQVDYGDGRLTDSILLEFNVDGNVWDNM